MEESREERRLKQEKKFFVFYPIEWLMVNENTKKGRIINLTIQVAVSILTTIITLNYLKK